MKPVPGELFVIRKTFDLYREYGGGDGCFKRVEMHEGELIVLLAKWRDGYSHMTHQASLGELFVVKELCKMYGEYHDVGCDKPVVIEVGDTCLLLAKWHDDYKVFAGDYKSYRPAYMFLNSRVGLIFSHFTDDVFNNVFQAVEE